jgi:hypothetical protein
MTTIEDAHGFIRQFITSLGVDPTACFNEQSKAYYLTRGSASIEIFVSSHPQQDGTTRNFLRVFSQVATVPADNRELFYHRILELCDQSLGLKLTIQPGTDKVYATFERDITGIDANETATCIADLGSWADYFDDIIKKEFGILPTDAGQAPKG